MQVAATAPGRLLHCIAIAISLALFFTSVITAVATEVDAHRQRSLSTWMKDDDGCHTTVLSNPLPSDFTLVQGVIFSLKSGVTNTSVSSLSVFLDESATSPSIGFDIFTMNGYNQTSIGATLDGSGDWKRIHGGIIEDTQFDNDGATFLGSFGPLTIEAGDTKSIYLRFTKSVLRVKNLGLDADGWDANAINLNDNDMQISIGRAAIFWITTNPDQFHQFYTPSIIPCKVWTQEACVPTASPTITSSPTTTRIFETETIVNNTIDLSFQARRSMFDTSSRNLQDDDVCSVNKEVIYPLLADSLEEVSMNAYKEDSIGTTRMLTTSFTFHSHEDVSVGKDCSVIRFYFDVQMEYAIAEDDETPPIELILLPLSDDSKRDEFLSTLTTNANNGNSIPYFSTLSSIGPVVVTQEGLRTRQPTAATPTISSASPTPAHSMSSIPTTQPPPASSTSSSQMSSSAKAISPSWALDCIMKLCLSWSILGFLM